MSRDSRPETRDRHTHTRARETRNQRPSTYGGRYMHTFSVAGCVVSCPSARQCTNKNGKTTILNTALCSSRLERIDQNDGGQQNGKKAKNKKKKKNKKPNAFPKSHTVCSKTHIYELYWHFSFLLPFKRSRSRRASDVWEREREGKPASRIDSSRPELARQMPGSRRKTNENIYLLWIIIISHFKTHVLYILNCFLIFMIKIIITAAEAAAAAATVNSQQ